MSAGNSGIDVFHADFDVCHWTMVPHVPGNRRNNRII